MDQRIVLFKIKILFCCIRLQNNSRLGCNLKQLNLKYEKWCSTSMAQELQGMSATLKVKNKVVFNYLDGWSDDFWNTFAFFILFESNYNTNQSGKFPNLPNSGGKYKTFEPIRLFCHVWHFKREQNKRLVQKCPMNESQLNWMKCHYSCLYCNKIQRLL